MVVKIYTMPTCGYCYQAKRFLSGLGINYAEYDVSRDRAAAEEVVRMTGQKMVPVIIVDDEIMVGFNRARLEQVLARGNHSHPRLGLTVADASKMRKSGGLPVSGAFIGAVSPSSPGERAGLKAGDIITEINQQPISNADDLERSLASLNAGSRVTIAFYRGKDILKSEIVI